MTSMKMVEVRYKSRELDAKWQERWEQDGLHDQQVDQGHEPELTGGFLYDHDPASSTRTR